MLKRDTLSSGPHEGEFSMLPYMRFKRRKDLVTKDVKWAVLCFD